MARSGFPSMTALLGLLAVAGYQNRDELGKLLRNAQGGGGMGGMGSGGGMGRDMDRDMAAGTGGLGGAMGGALGGGGLGGILGGLLGGGMGGGRAGGGLGDLLGGGLGELDGRFRQAGHGEAMDSWVGHGPNRQLNPLELESALGPDVLEDLQEQTGLPRDEILRRLSRELPDAVNQYTPDGRLPDRSSFA